jgi:hypothetical protein
MNVAFGDERPKNQLMHEKAIAPKIQSHGYIIQKAVRNTAPKPLVMRIMSVPQQNKTSPIMTKQPVAHG